MSAPWIAAQLRQLLSQRGHAWLLHGPSGLGQYTLSLSLAQAWLCDRPTADGACGQCDSCHQVAVRAHTDLVVLMPETAMLELGWPLAEKAQSELDEKKRKPSREIRIDAMRDTLEFAQRTSGRGRGKVVMVYPAERMNQVTANALLKTLEEPPGEMRFVLATEAAHQLLPTIRSRCQAHTLAWPSEAEAVGWLQEQGVPAAAAPVLLRAAGGRPEDALRLHAAGVDAKTWSAWPKALVRGDTGMLFDWSPAEFVEALQKLCHDLVALRSGAAPRFFAPGDLPAPASVGALTAWWRQLAETSRTVDHPFNAGLMLEDLVAQARAALNSRT
jgi:DNA polymerase-3 subunit delta'